VSIGGNRVAPRARLPGRPASPTAVGGRGNRVAPCSWLRGWNSWLSSIIVPEVHAAAPHSAGMERDVSAKKPGVTGGRGGLARAGVRWRRSLLPGRCRATGRFASAWVEVAISCGVQRDARGGNAPTNGKRINEWIGRGRPGATGGRGGLARAGVRWRRSLLPGRCRATGFFLEGVGARRRRAPTPKPSCGRAMFTLDAHSHGAQRRNEHSIVLGRAQPSQTLLRAGCFLGEGRGARRRRASTPKPSRAQAMFTSESPVLQWSS